MTKRTLPAIRARLMAIAYEIEDPDGPDLSELADEIRALCEESKRRFGGRKAKARQPRLTPELAEKIRAYALADLDASYSSIARHCGCNIGRVSEALIGFRGQEEQA